MPSKGRMSAQTDNNLPEIAAILVAGLQRLLERKYSQLSHCEAETLLDCCEPSEGHVRRKRKDLHP